MFDIWELDGIDRLDAIYDLRPFAGDDYHFAAKKNCLKCPLSIRYMGDDGYFHTSCTQAISRKRAVSLLSTGGRFLKKGEY